MLNDKDLFNSCKVLYSIPISSNGFEAYFHVYFHNFILVLDISIIPVGMSNHSTFLHVDICFSFTRYYHNFMIPHFHGIHGMISLCNTYDNRAKKH